MKQWKVSVITWIDRLSSHFMVLGATWIWVYSCCLMTTKSSSQRKKVTYNNFLKHRIKSWQQKTHTGLNVIKLHKPSVINQWELTVIINEALNRESHTNAWRASFDHVNFCPSYQFHSPSGLKTQRDCYCIFLSRVHMNLWCYSSSVVKHIREWSSPIMLSLSLIDLFPQKSTVCHLKHSTFWLCDIWWLGKLQICYFTAKEDCW